MRKLALAVSAAAVFAVPAAPAAADTTASAPPEIVTDVVNCATGTVAAYWRAINGYPQMYYCQIG
jgi:hypothetical protein